MQYLQAKICFLSIELLLSTFVLLSLLFATVCNSKKYSFQPLLKPLTCFSIFFFIALIVGFNYFEPNFFFSSFSVHSQLTFYSHFFKIVALVSCFSIALLNRDFFRLFLQGFEYDILLGFSILGLFILINSNNFLMVYLALELLSLSFYVLTCFHRGSEYATEAGLKYFLMGAFSSCLILFSFWAFYFLYGTCNIEHIAFLVVSGENTYFALLGFAFLIASLFFKIGAFPFHMWLFDIYEGTLISVTAFFSTVPKILLFALIAKLSYLLFNEFSSFFDIAFLGCAFLSIAFSSVAGLYQKRIKRLMVYSTISHTGFLLLAIFCCSILSLKAFVLYLTLYSLMSLCLFSFLMSLVIAGSNEGHWKYMVNWASSGSKNLWFSILFSLLLFSLAGIPPLSGFFSKFWSLLGLVDRGFISMSLAIILFSCIAAFFYIRLVKVFFFSTINRRRSFWFTSTAYCADYVCIVTSLITCLFCFFPNALIIVANLLALV